MRSDPVVYLYQSICSRVTSLLGHADSDEYIEIRLNVEKAYLRVLEVYLRIYSRVWRQLGSEFEIHWMEYRWIC